MPMFPSQSPVTSWLTGSSPLLGLRPRLLLYSHHCAPPSGGAHRPRRCQGRDSLATPAPHPRAPRGRSGQLWNVESSGGDCVMLTCCYKEILKESTLGKGGFILAQQCEGTAPSWWREPEAAGHVTSTVGRQSARNAGPHLTFSFPRGSECQPRGWCRP